MPPLNWYLQAKTLLMSEVFVIGNASSAWTSAWGIDVHTSLPLVLVPGGSHLRGRGIVPAGCR